MRQSYITFVCCLIWAQSAVADDVVPRRIQETIHFVQNLQTESGGFAAVYTKQGKKPGPPSLRATSAALRALKYFGGKVLNEPAAKKYVASCFDESSGGFANTPGGKPDVFSTAIGIMAVSALEMPTGKYAKPVVDYSSVNAKTFDDIRIAVAGFERINVKAPKAEEWLAQVRKLQNPDGTFGEGDAVARATGSAVVTMLRLGAKIKQRDNILKALKEGQRLSGGFGKGDNPIASDLESSYRVMRAFHMLEALPNDVEGMRSFVEKCRNEDGGYSFAPAEESNVAATYFASIIHHWLKGKS